MKRNLLRPTLLDFDSWIQEKAEAHDRMLSTSKIKLNSSAATNNKPKTTMSFSSTAADREPNPCVLCNGKHPLFMCPVFKRNNTNAACQILRRIEVVYLFPEKKENCKSTLKVLLHESELIFCRAVEPERRAQLNLELKVHRKAT